MAKLVMIINLEITPGNSDAFIAAACKNARSSVDLEPGCHRFDIIRDLNDSSKITMYEVFDSAEAFQAHAEYPHAVEFAATAKALVAKAVPRRGELVSE